VIVQKYHKSPIAIVAGVNAAVEQEGLRSNKQHNALKGQILDINSNFSSAGYQQE
jgi:hypothetical protein